MSGWCLFNVDRLRRKTFDGNSSTPHKPSEDGFIHPSHYNRQLLCSSSVRIRAVAESKNIVDKANEALVKALNPRLKKLVGW